MTKDGETIYKLDLYEMGKLSNGISTCKDALPQAAVDELRKVLAERAPTLLQKSPCTFLALLSVVSALPAAATLGAYFTGVIGAATYATLFIPTAAVSGASALALLAECTTPHDDILSD